MSDERPNTDDRSIFDAESDSLSSIVKERPIELHIWPGFSSDHIEFLIECLAGARREIARRYGFIVPGVRVRHHPSLSELEYDVLLFSTSVERGKIGGETHREQALNFAGLMYRNTTRRLADFLTRDEMMYMLNRSMEVAPMATAELVPGLLTLGQVRAVFQELLAEHVSVQNVSRIVDLLVERAAYTTDIDQLVSAVRMELSRSICENAALDRVIRAWHLSDQLTTALESALEFSHGGGHHLVLSRECKQLLRRAWLEQTKGAHEDDWPRVIVCGQNVRRHVHRALSSTEAMLTVLSEQEIRPDFQLQILGTIDAVLSSDDTTSRSTLTD